MGRGLLLVVAFVLVGGLAAYVYWLVAGTVQMALVSPFVLWMTRKHGGLDNAEPPKLIVPVVLGSIVTIVSCLLWTFLVGSGVLLLIRAVPDLHWAKWLFLTLGFFLAIYNPDLVDGSEWGLQGAIAALTMVIGYLLNVIFILHVALPHHTDMLFTSLAGRRGLNLLAAMGFYVLYGFLLLIAILLVIAISHRLGRARPGWRNTGAFTFALLSAYSASFALDIIAVTLRNHVSLASNLPSMITWSLGGITWYYASVIACSSWWTRSVPYFAIGIVSGLAGVVGHTYNFLIGLAMISVGFLSMHVGLASVRRAK